jgi:hypothetical protein
MDETEKHRAMVLAVKKFISKRVLVRNDRIFQLSAKPH